MSTSSLIIYLGAIFVLGFFSIVQWAVSSRFLKIISFASVFGLTFLTSLCTLVIWVLGFIFIPTDLEFPQLQSGIFLIPLLAFGYVAVMVALSILLVTDFVALLLVHLLTVYWISRKRRRPEEVSNGSESSEKEGSPPCTS